MDWTHPTNVLLENSLDLAANEYNLTIKEARDHENPTQVRAIALDAIFRMEAEIENMQKAVKALKASPTDIYNHVMR